MNDDFFDDEQELMAAGAEPSAPGPNGADGAARPDEPARRSGPPFWMVLAIAAISLILGIVIGYLLGTSATLAELGAASEQAANEQTAQSDASAALPEGHPQLSIDEDGNATVADDASAAE